MITSWRDFQEESIEIGEKILDALHEQGIETEIGLEALLYSVRTMAKETGYAYMSVELKRNKSENDEDEV